MDTSKKEGIYKCLKVFKDMACGTSSMWLGIVMWLAVASGRKGFAANLHDIRRSDSKLT